jgi:hypothetical protein
MCVDYANRRVRQLVDWERHRLMRELPDREHRAEDEERINEHFQPAAAFLFRANQESVSRFEVIHKVLLVDANPYATTVPPIELVF